MVRGRIRASIGRELLEWQKAGYTRVRIDGAFHDIERRARARQASSNTTLKWWSTASSCAKGSKARLADSFEQALKLADGLAYVDPADAPPSPSGEGRGVGSVRESLGSENADSPHPDPSR